MFIFHQQYSQVSSHPTTPTVNPSLLKTLFFLFSLLLIETVICSTGTERASHISICFLMFPFHVFIVIISKYDCHSGPFSALTVFSSLSHLLSISIILIQHDTDEWTVLCSSSSKFHSVSYSAFLLMYKEILWFPPFL